MKNILIHGLGQNHKSWNETIKFLEIDNIDVLCPALLKCQVAIAMIIKTYFLLSLISVTIRKENLIYVDFH